jgi:hypothetical protein
MTANEIYELARKKQPVPEGINLSEQMLYTIARNIYAAYSDGTITEHQAKLDKAKSIKSFEVMALSERVCAEHMRRMTEISRVLLEAEKSDCPQCREISRIFDGRIRSAAAAGSMRTHACNKQ